VSWDDTANRQSNLFFFSIFIFFLPKENKRRALSVLSQKMFAKVEDGVWQ
jgi:hypothetical protein